MVLHLTEPYNNTQSQMKNGHFLQANFTWSAQTLNSIQTSHFMADIQIIPLRGLMNILRGMKEDE